GVPDAATSGITAGGPAVFQKKKLKTLGDLFPHVTPLPAYLSSQVGGHWGRPGPRERGRLWAGGGGGIKNWKEKKKPNHGVAQQERFWKWLQDNVDFRVRSSKV